MPDIVARVEALEHENRRLRRLVAAMLLVAAALLIMAQKGQQKPPKRPDVIKAQAFELVDKNGNAVAILDGRGAPDRVELRIGEAGDGDRIVLASVDGQAVLQLQNTQGRLANLVVSEKGPAVQLLDPSRNASATLGIGDQGVMFGLQDRGQMGAALNVGAKGRVFFLYDHAGKTTFSAPN